MRVALVIALAPSLAIAQPTPDTPAKPDAPVSDAPAQPPTPPPQEHFVEMFRPPPGDDEPPPEPYPALPYHRLQLELELFTSADYTHREDGSELTEFRLDRAELGGTIHYDPNFGAELRLETVRSAAEGGELGIAGDSLVVRIKRAQLFGDLDTNHMHVRAAAGVTPDPWIATLEQDDSVRPLSPTASERLLGWPTGDLAGLVRVTAGPVRLSVSFGNGEGLAYPERNNGKTTTAVAEVVPYFTRTQRLRLAVMAKDGSVGPALVRDHRLGGAATFTANVVAAGAELVRAWGVGDRGDIVALVAGGWADVATGGPFHVALRAATAGYAAGGRHSTLGGALAIEPWNDPERGRMRVWLAVDRATASGNAAPLPGADPGNATTVMLLLSTTLPYGAD
jgi:hypothetical protein